MAIYLDRHPGGLHPRGPSRAYPAALAERLVKMFSFAGDTVLDPFLGTGSTTVAEIAAGRNSIGIEVDPGYLKMASDNIAAAASASRKAGAVEAAFTRGGETAPEVRVR